MTLTTIKQSKRKRKAKKRNWGIYDSSHSVKVKSSVAKFSTELSFTTIPWQKTIQLLLTQSLFSSIDFYLHYNIYTSS